jgi:mannose-6-phosphate isomerase-like protein (cupin superfamily)
MVVQYLLATLVLCAPQKTKSVGEVLSTCYRVVSARNYKLNGRIWVKLTMGTKGEVEKINILKDTIGSRPLMRCVKYHIFKKKFPRKKSLVYKFKFPKLKGQYSVWSSDIPINRSLGNGSAARVILDKKSAGTKKVALSVLRISKKGRITSRFHPKAHMFFVIISGTGTFQWAISHSKTKYLPISKGSIVYIPKGTVYSIKGSSNPPLVAIVFNTPLGPEKLFASGLSENGTVILPPKGIPMTSKIKPEMESGKKARYTQINLEKIVKNGGMKTFFKIKGVGVLGVFKSMAGKKATFKPFGKGEMAAFVLQGGGNLDIKRGRWPVQPGSGLYLPSKAVFKPVMKKIPFYALWFSSDGKPRIIQK